MKTALFWALVTAIPAHAQTAPREVNITADSAPGWIPSPEMERVVERATTAYFAALDSGDFRTAYAMLATAQRENMSFEDFAGASATSRAQAGPVRDRAIIKVTWTKDPHNAPYPGIYAAVDVTARFANVDRQCGYLIWYQPPGGGPFTLMRSQTARLDNATAAQIEREQSLAALDRAWTDLSSYCPNYAAPE